MVLRSELSAASRTWSPWVGANGSSEQSDNVLLIDASSVERSIVRSWIIASESDIQSVRCRRHKDGRNHARGMTILIRGGRAASRRRDGLMMVIRISSSDLVLYLETLQDGEHGVKSCGGLGLIYSFIFTGDTVLSRLIYPLSSSSYTYSS